MLTFDYTARDPSSNKHIKSTVQADSERAAAKLIMAQGLAPLKISMQEDDGDIFSKFTNRIGAKDKVVFSRQLATLINAGLPLAQSLRTVIDQTANKKLKAVVQTVLSDIESGKTLADSFARYPDVFSNVFVALIAAGEASGTLDQSLERISSQQEKDAEIASKVRGAMVYPAIVFVVIIGVVIFMMVTVVPQIEQLYRDLKQTLPFVTQSLVAIASFMRNFWWLIVILLGVGIYFAKRYVETDGGRALYDSMKLHVPLFGRMFQKLYMARFMRTGQTLMVSGVTMLETLAICARAVNNVQVAQSIRKAADKVKGGKALSIALKDSDNILPLVPRMIGIGEQSGSIDAMMDKAATFYENELDNEIRAISTAIEPVMMVVLAAVAGLMVVAILLPVYGLIGSGAIR